MSGVMYHGSSADGSDMRISLGVFVNPKNDNEWSTEPYDSEQRAIQKDYYDWEAIYNQLDGRTLFDEYQLVLQKKSKLPYRLRKMLVEQAKEEGL